MKVAFVVQRYGPEVAGGAEALCRQTAHALAEAGEDVTVYTTTARDYLHWRRAFPPGPERDGPVEVLRFDAEPPDPARSARLLRQLSLGVGGAAAEDAWARAQGPVAPGLLGALTRVRERHEVVALWTYLYATTQLAMPLVADRAVLVPCAHDEPMLRFGLTRGLVRMAAAHAFLTPEEQRLVAELHGANGRPASVVGAGVDGGPAAEPARARATMPLPPRFALYVGRVDAAKGIDALVRAHAAYRSAGGSLGLVLAGRPAGRLRVPDWVVCTGFVDPGLRADLMAACEVAILPGRHESLSLAALEAWRAERPTLANARSEVLAGQTARSGGGLLYNDARSYGRQLSRLASDAELRALLGRAGSRFAEGWTWPAAVRRWRALLAETRQPLAGARRNR